MSTAAASLAPKERLEVLFGELSELCGQRNAIDGRIVAIVAQLEREDLAGMTGAKSVPALVAWKTGVSTRNAETMVAIARRLDELPRCTDGLREGRLSLDQVGVIAERGADGSDEHYAELAESATVTQLIKAINLAPKPEQPSRPERGPEFSKTVEDNYTTYRIRLPRIDAAKFDAAHQSHRDKLIADHQGDVPFPTNVDAF
ncbi:MAG: DUF222 domain-containing protein, partial [Mycobacterium sp.]